MQAASKGRLLFPMRNLGPASSALGERRVWAIAHQSALAFWRSSFPARIPFTAALFRDRPMGNPSSKRPECCVCFDEADDD
jgi:hypothetical protein